MRPRTAPSASPRVSALAGAFALMLGLPAHAAPGPMAVEQGWIREAPPGATVLGAYMTLRNRGDRPDRLLRVQTPVAGRVEIHEMAVQNGVMRMRPLKALVVAPGGTAVLRPMSTHMMLMDLKRPLKAGARVPMTFVFEHAGSLEVELPVKRSD